MVYFIHQFRPYLLGKRFTLRTDHGSLTWLMNFKEPEGQLARWLERLQEYDMKIVHHRVGKNSNADAMSRLPCQQCGRESHNYNSSTVEEKIQFLTVKVIGSRNNQELCQLQLDDEIVGPLLKAKESRKKPHVEHLKENPTLRRLHQLWEQLSLNDGLLFRKFKLPDGSSNHLQWVAPRCLYNEILDELHSGVASGHFEEEKTLSRLKERSN